MVYTLEFCPNCEVLKEFLKSREVTFMERDMNSAEALTDLRINGVFVQEAPVLQVGSTFLTNADLFADGELREDAVTGAIETGVPGGTGRVSR
ncbi:MAG: glutaredoxin family protein [Methanomicrobiales archaeon]